MKKLLALCLLLSLLLGGCNAGQRNSSPEGNEPEEEPASGAASFREESGERVVEIEESGESEESSEPPLMRLTFTPEEAQKLLQPGGDNVVEINSAEQLAALAVLVASGDKAHEKITYRLQRDIGLAGLSLAPIGGGETATDCPMFGGTFDGGGHILSQLTVESEYACGAGLFGAVGPSGRVQNLHITGASVTSTAGDMAGGVAGICYGQLYNCSFRGEVSCPGTGVGALAGVLGNGAEPALVSQCFTNASVSGNSEVGGFVGGAASGAAIEDCYALGAVTAVQPAGKDIPYQIGGFAGGVNSAKLSRCYSNMEVYTEVESKWVGAFIGYMSGSPEQCYYNSAATENWKDIGVNDGENPYGLTGCSVEEITEKATFKGWDFTGVWDIAEDRNRGLPFLRAAWEE